MTLYLLAQVAIPVLGIPALFCTGSQERAVRRFGFICGVAAQPAWLYCAYTDGQWGTFGMCFLYIYGWARGAHNNRG